MKRIVYSMTGVLLMILVLAMGTYGLDDTDRQIYEMAMEIEDSVNGYGFSSFSIRDRRIRFSDGDSDYVMWEDSCTKEEAVYDSLVGTIAEVDGEYQVVVPFYQELADLLQTVGTLAEISEGSTLFNAEEYSTEAHAATIWHEAFHAWQFEQYESRIEDFMENADSEKQETQAQTPESILAEQVDSHKDCMETLENELRYLYNAYKAENREETIRWLEQALAEENSRRERLSEEAAKIEIYLETVEGTARYVEMLAFRQLTSDEEWENTYLTEKEISGGTEKYYQIGMLKSLLLDRLNPGWKEEFSLPYDFNAQFGMI